TPAHGLRDDRALLDAEVVDERLEVIDELRDALARGVQRAAKAAVVHGDAAVRVPEHGDLLPPRHVVATGTVVPEDHRLAILVRGVAVLVEQLDAVDPRGRHLASPHPRRRDPAFDASSSA